MKVSPEQLPLRLSRSFRPWAYTVSHRTLTLRSDGNEAAGETVYVRFLDVLAMQVRHRFHQLTIAPGSTGSSRFQTGTAPGTYA